MDPNTIIRTIETVYSDYNGWEISRKNIEKRSSFSRAMKYDEASTESFLQALELTKPTSEDIFVDLGSGLGKKVVAAALTKTMSRCIGIEMLEDLYSVSNQIREKLNSSTIEFKLGNYDDIDFSYASIVHISISPAMIDFQLDGDLGQKLKQFKKGTRLIISEIPIGFPEFYQINRINYDFPSRKEYAFIYRKEL